MGLITNRLERLRGTNERPFDDSAERGDRPPRRHPEVLAEDEDAVGSPDEPESHGLDDLA